MTFEERVQTALRAADEFEPSDDLFAKVQRSIDEDAAHRRRVGRVLLRIGAGVGAIGLYLVLTVDVSDGRPEMSFRALELLVAAVMAVLLVVLGPAIRRFGSMYEEAVFHSSPGTGAHVLRLLDVAYYLIFAGYILVTTRFEPELARWPRSLGAWIEAEFVRLGGMLLLMGSLHVALVIALPVVGLVVAANERRARRVALGPLAPPASPIAERIDKAVGVAVWALAMLGGIFLLNVVIGLVIGGAG